MNLIKYVYIFFVSFLGFFFIITLATSIMRYKANLNELNKIKRQYEELNDRYQKNMAIYQKLKSLEEGRK